MQSDMQIAMDMSEGPVTKRDRSTRVLVVEDDTCTRMIAQAMLEPYCKVSCVPNILQGVSSVWEDEPDLVLLDIGLPDGNGYKLLDWIRHTFPETKVVMFSGSGSTENIAYAARHGAAGFVPKPLTLAKVMPYL